jgi:hypothetical protein
MISKESSRVPFSLLAVGLLLLALLLSTAGCSYPGRATAMIPEDLTASRRGEHSVSTRVSGGKDSSIFSPGQISNGAFEEALKTSLLRSGVFSNVIQAGDADYVLEVVMSRGAQPLVGFALTVRLAADWKLTRVKTGEVILEQHIATEGAASPGDALVFDRRVGIAHERAAQSNILKGIQLLSALDL